MRYVEGIRLTCLLGGIVAVAACGAPPELGGEEDLESAPERRLSTCLSCPITPGIGTHSYTTPPSRLVASPTMLMFYGDASAPAGLAPQKVLVENDTHDAVEVTNAYVIDDPTGSSGAGGAEFFSVVFPDMKGRPIEHGETISLEVAFLASSVQRTAVLVIETTHVTYPALNVDLAGKYFTNSW